MRSVSILALTLVGLSGIALACSDVPMTGKDASAGKAMVVASVSKASVAPVAKTTSKETVKVACDPKPCDDSPASVPGKAPTKVACDPAPCTDTPVAVAPVKSDIKVACEPQPCNDTPVAAIQKKHKKAKVVAAAY